MSSSLAFVTLAGLRPGLSTLSEAAVRFPFASREAASDQGCCWSCPARGIRVFVAADHIADFDPVLCEVHIFEPNHETLPCGVCVGQAKTEALQLIRATHRVTAEYEDSIYFQPDEAGDLLASVEFRQVQFVMAIELMLRDSSPD